MRNVRGILAMIASSATSSCGDTFMKLATTSLPTGELIFLRGMFVSSVALLIAHLTGALPLLRSALIAPVCWRAAGDMAGALFFQSALARMPYPDLVAVNQLQPLSITAASAIWLREHVGWRRWSAALAGFLGVLLIIQPGSDFNWWALAGIAAVLSTTVRDIATRSITTAIPGVLIMTISSGAVTLSGLALSLFESWAVPPLGLIGLMACAATCSLVGQLCVIFAMRTGEVSVVAPFRYSLIVFSILLGYIVWGHFPDGFKLVGIAIVVGAGLYTFHREQVLRRERVISPPS